MKSLFYQGGIAFLITKTLTRESNLKTINGVELQQESNEFVCI